MYHFQPALSIDSLRYQLFRNLLEKDTAMSTEKLFTVEASPF